ncbi:MAG: hypothetical protein N2485_03985 [bacterium]|nr:hypothetical protein [bacterium]
MGFKDLIKENYMVLNDLNKANDFKEVIKIQDFSKDINSIIHHIEYLEKSIFKDKYKHIGLFLYSNFVMFISLGGFLLIFSLSYIIIFLVFLAAYKLLYFIFSFLFFNLIFLLFLIVSLTFLFKVFIRKIKIYLNLKITEFWIFLLNELYIVKNELLDKELLNKKAVLDSLKGYGWFYFVLFLVKILLVFSDFILKFINHILILIFLIFILGLFNIL